MQQIERKLGALKKEIKAQIASEDYLLPIGESGNIGTFRPQRLYHSFETIQEERANDWIDRAYKIYCDQWIAQGGEKTRDFIFAVWSNALYHFIMEDILLFLRVAFAVDERATKLFDRTYRTLPSSRSISFSWRFLISPPRHPVPMATAAQYIANCQYSFARAVVIRVLI
jgi:hypothetical protein